MCEIAVRTNEGEYSGGETVYGAVYVKIDKPTAASGVWLKFSGCESCYFQSQLVGDTSDPFHEQCEYIKCENIVLYESPGPFAIGSYVFPFQKRLPRDLPGSFHQKSQQGEGSEWMAEVAYRVEAQLIGAPEIQASQVLIIRQDLSISFGVEFPTAVEKTEIIKGLLRQGKLTACLRVNKKVYYVGETVSASVEFQCEGSVPPVSRLNFALKNELVITRRQAEEESTTPSSGILSIFHMLCSDGQQPPSTQYQDTFQPDQGPKTVWQSHMLARDNINLQKGVRNLMIPLCDDSGKWVSTTAGNHVFSLYWLEAEVLVKGSVTLILQLPLPHVRWKNPQWESWIPPGWLQNCVLLPQPPHECSVPSDVIGSSTFSSLPCFHVM